MSFVMKVLILSNDLLFTCKPRMFSPRYKIGSNNFYKKKKLGQNILSKFKILSKWWWKRDQTMCYRNYLNRNSISFDLKILLQDITENYRYTFCSMLICTRKVNALFQSVLPGHGAAWSRVLFSTKPIGHLSLWLSQKWWRIKSWPYKLIFCWFSFNKKYLPLYAKKTEPKKIIFLSL